MFVCPQFVPPSLEQLTQEIDEVTVLVKREAQLNKELDEVQKHNKDVVPMGVVRVPQDVEEEEEDEGEPNDDEASDVSEEEIEEDGGEGFEAEDTEEEEEDQGPGTPV